MKPVLAFVALAGLCCLSSPVLAQRAPVEEGNYRCLHQGASHGSFQITGRNSYTGSDGGQGTYEFDRGMNLLRFDTGSQYFIGGKDLLVVIENGQFTKIGCVRQRR